MIVTPATLMQQWVSEIHRWLPQIRVAILHQSGSHSGERVKKNHQKHHLNHLKTISKPFVG